MGIVMKTATDWSKDFKEGLSLLGFKHIGFLWFENESETVRIRLWHDSELVIWKWDFREDMRQQVFIGRIDNIEDLKWLLKRVSI